MEPGARMRVPLWLLPNLWSLDAPAVAISWELLFARALNVRVPVSATAVLVACTWLIYVADRLLDAARGEQAGARHRFYLTHRSAVLPVFAAMLLGTVVIAVTRLPRSMFAPGAAVSGLVALHLAMVHLAPERWRRLWPKELLVALVFALGVVVPIVGSAARYPAGALAAFVIFLLLCWINCAVIEENEPPAWGAASHPTTRLLNRRGARVAAFATCLSVLCAIVWREQLRLLMACALAAAALAWLLARRKRVSSDAFRVLADCALLSPLLVLLAL